MTTQTDLKKLDFGFRGEVYYPVSVGPAPTDFTEYGSRGEPLTITGPDTLAPTYKPGVKPSAYQLGQGRGRSYRKTAKT